MSDKERKIQPADVSQAIDEWRQNRKEGEKSWLALYNEGLILICQATNQPLEVLDLTLKNCEKSFFAGLHGKLPTKDKQKKFGSKRDQVEEGLTTINQKLNHPTLVSKAFFERKVSSTARQQWDLLKEAGLEEGGEIWNLLLAQGVAYAAKTEVLDQIEKRLKLLKKGVQITDDYFDLLLGVTEYYRGFTFTANEIIEARALEIFGAEKAKMALRSWWAVLFLRTNYEDKEVVEKILEQRLPLFSLLVQGEYREVQIILGWLATKYPSFFIPQQVEEWRSFFELIEVKTIPPRALLVLAKMKAEQIKISRSRSAFSSPPFC